MYFQSSGCKYTYAYIYIYIYEDFIKSFCRIIDRLLISLHRQIRYRPSIPAGASKVFINEYNNTSQFFTSSWKISCSEKSFHIFHFLDIFKTHGTELIDEFADVCLHFSGHVTSQAFERVLSFCWNSCNKVNGPKEVYSPKLLEPTSPRCQVIVLVLMSRCMNFTVFSFVMVSNNKTSMYHIRVLCCFYCLIISINIPHGCSP